MTEAIRHRGPDAEGYFDAPSIHLGSRRLRVLDLRGGDQPMWNEDRSICVVYNGEIYNHRALRAELRQLGHRFASSTDTEVLVHLYEEHGDDLVHRLEGMYAFALWDGPRRRLLLARDPVGIKPLFYAQSNGVVVFASEAKSILLHPLISADLDPQALHQLLNIRFVPGPSTMFRGISHLPPGYRLVVEGNGTRLERFHQWDFPGKGSTDLEQAAGSLHGEMARAVERQMISDVPVGIYLSGGVDSSSILSAATSLGGGSPIRTFSLGFGEPTDELGDARIVAEHFGSEHHEMLAESGPLALLPRTVYHAEVPKVNTLQGYLLARFARQRVTVALSGLGGDELFLGYEIYRYLWPGERLSRGAWARLASAAAPAADSVARVLDRTLGLHGDRQRRMAELLASGGDPVRYYLTLRNGWDLGGSVGQKLYTSEWLQGLKGTTRDAMSPYFDRPELPLIEQVQWAEFRVKMVDDFLANEDRMSMANSLEVRVPLLDEAIIRLAFSLPLNVKFQKGQLKPVMRRALEGRVPDIVLRKKKWGFTFDSFEQFKKDLRGICLRELTPRFIGDQGIFRYSFVQRVLEARPSASMRWHYFMLWQMLGLKFWQEIFLDGTSWQEIEERIRR
ncbi:MAG: asparagine synthase (glutamine-hydrolyzing) [Thermoanaerobaculia bacterium]|nr:asparagine synthase (glutamine-hydrolyzing) [Thermoanaerobaculia bacterium]